MAEVLLDNGADINWLVDKKNGWTFLMQLAATSQRVNAKEKQLIMIQFKFLLEHGAKTDINDNRSRAVEKIIQEKSDIKEDLMDMLSNTPQIYFHQFRKKTESYLYAQIAASRQQMKQGKGSKESSAKAVKSKSIFGICKK